MHPNTGKGLTRGKFGRHNLISQLGETGAGVGRREKRGRVCVRGGGGGERMMEGEVNKERKREEEVDRERGRMDGKMDR